MSGNYLHFNASSSSFKYCDSIGIWVIHDFSNTKYYETTLTKDGPTGVPYKPYFQSYAYSLTVFTNDAKKTGIDTWRSWKQSDVRYYYVDDESYTVQIDLSYESDHGIWTITPGNYT